MFSIRGAITVEIDERNELVQASEELMSLIISRNSIAVDDIVSVFFSSTRDLRSAYPAVGARNVGIVRASIMCFQEMYVENSLQKCIRVMVIVNGDRSQNDVNHVYLKKAINLRPDLAQ